MHSEQITYLLIWVWIYFKDLPLNRLISISVFLLFGNHSYNNFIVFRLLVVYFCFEFKPAMLELLLYLKHFISFSIISNLLNPIEDLSNVFEIIIHFISIMIYFLYPLKLILNIKLLFSEAPFPNLEFKKIINVYTM